MLNRAELIGHLGGDPEIRRTQDGRPIVNFSLATSERWTDKTTGEKKEKTEWHLVVIFNEGLARTAEQYLKKGSKVYLQGKIATRKWQDQSGQDRYSTEIVIEAYRGEMILLDGRERAPGAASPDDYGARREARGATAASARSSAAHADMDDEIPF